MDKKIFTLIKTAILKDFIIIKNNICIFIMDYKYKYIKYKKNIYN